MNENDNHPLTNDTYDWGDDSAVRLQTVAGELLLSVSGGGGSIASHLPRENDEAGLRYDAFLDALESITLAHACAGINVRDPHYVEGLNTALEAAANNL